jgi:cephalosporin hydroxylase
VSQAAPKITESGVAGVPGWFSFSELYNRVVDEAPPGSWLVEVGVYHGLSLRHLAHAAKAADKNLTVVGIDWFRGSPEHRDHVDALPGRNLAGAALETLLTAGVADDCALIAAPAARAAKFIPDGACYMVFIDGDHSFEGCMSDIRTFLPKVMRGGIIAGHDYFVYPGVRQAVHQAFGAKDWMCRDASCSWEVRL